MQQKRLILYVTDQEDLAQSAMRFVTALGLQFKNLTPLEGLVIPKEYSPSEVREILIHAGLSMPKGTGLDLAEKLSQADFAVSLISACPTKEHEATGIPVIWSPDLSKHLKELIEEEGKLEAGPSRSPELF